MANIVFTRIDDRLIHGQVITGWLRYSNANSILIVDDQVAKDDFMLGVLEMSAPPNTKVIAMTISDAITMLKEDSSDEKILILTKTPKPVLELVQGGLKIEHLNVGGMGYKVGREKLYRNIHASNEEIEDLKTLDSLGVNVEFRVVIDHKAIPLKEVIS